jgi:hypothetical protein
MVSGGGNTKTAKKASIRVASKKATLGAGARVDLRLACGAGSPGACKGTLSLMTRHKVAAARGARKKLATLGRARYTVAAGESATVKLKVTAAGARLLRTQATARQVEAIATVVGGPTARRALTLTPRQRHSSHGLSHHAR